jgi:hypothetical protein
MSTPRRRRPQGRRSTRTSESKPVELWRRVPPLPEPQPIVPVDDPTALLRSLGDPPLPGNGVAAAHYLASVIERAAILAIGLAATADSLNEPGSSSTDAEQDALT